MSRTMLLGLGVLVFILLLGGCSYNRLVGLDEDVNGAWADVETTYQRRADLIDNLVSTVKGAADFEQETLQAVVEARARASQTTFDQAPTADQLEEYAAAQAELGGALSRLLVTVEAYPQLQATQAFRDLMSQLEGTENRIAVARTRFNEVARDYNAVRRGFPTVLYSGLLGFDSRAYFESDPGAENAPSVDFGTDE